MSRADEVLTGASSNNNILPEKQSIFVDYRELNVYQFLTDMYTGKGGVSGRTSGSIGRPLGNKLELNAQAPAYSFINPNPTENFYETRVRRSVYVNRFKQYIQAKYRAVFKIPPRTNVKTGSGNTLEGHPFTDWTADVNGAGMSKNTYLQNVLDSAYRNEVSFMVMDKDEGATEPRAYMQGASSVEDYDTDAQGNLIAITFVDSTKDGDYRRAEWTLEDRTVRQYTSDDCSNWTLDREGTFPGDRLPIEPVFINAREDVYEYLPDPSSYAVATMCFTIYDASSLLDWLLEKQGHDTMYVTGYVDGIREGMTNVMQIESVSGAATAGILSPDANKATVHQARIEQKTADLFDLMLDGGVLVSKNNNAPESGVAKAYTFSPVNDALLHTTMLCNKADKWLQEQYKIYQGAGEWVAVTEYREDYSPVMGLDVMTLREVLDIFEGRNLTENARDILKRLVAFVTNGDDSEQVQGLLAEVEANYNAPAGGEL